ncbi:MAG: cytochrome c oxidase subunit 3, partial [Candidatus Acidiferrales bacterium]
PEATWILPSRRKTGMLCLITAEAAAFTIFVVAYIYYLQNNIGGMTPAQILRVPVLNTICLLSSSLTIHLATRALRKEKLKVFLLWWTVTLGLGLKFIIGTGTEWYRMIYHEGFTIQTNLFGTSYYSLVGLHAFHVIVGLAGLTIVFALALAGKVKQEHSEHCEAFSMYWHFVDAVWVVVFTVVYLIGR